MHNRNYVSPRPMPLLRRLHRGITLLEILIAIVAVGLLYAWFAPPYHPPTVHARVSELILAASSAKTALSEGTQAHGGTWSPSWMSSITISAAGMVKEASIGPTGMIVVTGTAPTSGSVITMTPSITTDNKLVWICTGTPAKYMPASCRN